MKDIILTAISILTLFLSGCSQFMYSHNGTQVASGDYVRIGLGDYGLTFGRGTLLTQAARENTLLELKMQDGNDFSGAPTTKMDSVKSIRIHIGPQVTGYLVDLAQVDMDAATAYVGQMGKLNKTSWSADQQTTAMTKQSSGEKSTSDNYIDYLKEKLKGITGSGSTDYKSPFSDSCELTNLYEHPEIEYQAQLTADLLKYADDVTEMPDTGETIKDTLIHYAGRLAQLKAKGIEKATKITLGKATIKDGKLISLRYRLKMDDGTYQDESCPNCFELEDK